MPAELQTDYTFLSTNIISTLSTFVDDLFQDSDRGDEDVYAHIVEKVSPSQPAPIDPSETQYIFGPIMENPDSSTYVSGRQAPSFENGSVAVYEDLAPYIRNIVASDVNLEQHRIALSGLLSQGGKRIRTTRASRAALEGGDKATTRKERWFPSHLSLARVLATGGQGWQDLLPQQKTGPRGELYDNIASEDTGHDCESSSEGGI